MVQNNDINYPISRTVGGMGEKVLYKVVEHHLVCIVQKKSDEFIS